MTPEFYETLKLFGVLCCVGAGMLLTTVVTLYIIAVKGTYES